MHARIGILASLVILLSAWAPKAVAQAQTKEPPVYVVFFGFTIADNARVENFQIKKTISLLARSREEKNLLTMPQSFIDAARKETESLKLTPPKDPTKSADTTILFLYAPSQSLAAPVSWHVFDGLKAIPIPMKWAEISGHAGHFTKGWNNMALSVDMFTTSQQPLKPEQREAWIDEEIKRAAAKVGGAEIVSRKDTAEGDQLITEVIMKPPQPKNALIRRRFICSDRIMLGFTAIYQNDVDKVTREALDKMFEEFRFW